MTLGHAVNDTSMSTLSGLLPVLTPLFGLSYLLAGAVALVLNVTSSILQPLFGYVFDRTKATLLIEVGLAVNCIGMGLIGVIPNYSMLLIVVGAGGLGHAAFHSPAFSTVVSSGDTPKGRSMSIFTSGGNIGSFVGPFLAGVLVSTLGRQGLLLLIPTGLATAALLFKIVPHSERDTLPKTGSVPANKRLLLLLICITAFRSATIQSPSSFLWLFPSSPDLRYSLLS